MPIRVWAARRSKFIGAAANFKGYLVPFSVPLFQNFTFIITNYSALNLRHLGLRIRKVEVEVLAEILVVKQLKRFWGSYLKLRAVASMGVVMPRPALSQRATKPCHTEAHCLRGR